LNSLEKIVSSRTLEQVGWNNSRMAKSDAAEEIGRLKEQSGKDIFVNGGEALAQSPSRQGLIDEYNVGIYPVALGAGKRLFVGLPARLGLRLGNATTFNTGAGSLTYQAA